MGAQLPMGPAAFPCDGGGDDDDNCHHHHYGSIANYKKSRPGLLILIETI